MGGGTPPHSLHTLSKHSHGRSCSRNNSISSFLPSSSAPSLAPQSVSDPPPLNANVSLNPPPKRPTSHHHRRSSVSTRHESAELMGVSLPELPTAHPDDNVNLGDKDSIRRRALWALEGKPDLAFSKVEIPDITSPDTTKPFEFREHRSAISLLSASSPISISATKPSFPPGSGLNGSNGFVGKRDSFGKMFGPTSSSKDQLGTLVEEEEEEEEAAGSVKEPNESSQEHSPAKIFTRHRPASLNLRPLSLVQGSIANSVTGNLPTPTPGSRPNARKPFATTSLDGSVSPNVVPQLTTRRFSYTCSDIAPPPCNLDRKRCSSISYKHSSIPRDMFPLPTPEMTPTERRFSFASDQETLIEQPLSAADQHFLYRSHHVLLSRITELERTLRTRTSHFPHISYPSGVSAASTEPSDEMLQLISDLKAERDELKRDVDGWRQRVADADKQVSMLAKRIESESKEAWIVRSRLGLLEVEKSGLEKSLEAKATALAQFEAENADLMRERDAMKDEMMKKLNTRLKDMDAAIADCARLRAALEQERIRRKELEKLLDDAGLLTTPKLPHAGNGAWRLPPFSAKQVTPCPRGLGFQSTDSENSTTDVESADDSFTKVGFTLDAVTGEGGEFCEEENGLAGYEDEEDSDLSFSSLDGSFIGSADGLDIISKVSAVDIPNCLVSPAIPNRPPHGSRTSLSKTWTFPRGKTATPVKQDDEIDRFFGCLDDVDRSPPCFEEMNRSKFSSAFQLMSDDELPPFVLPSDVGVVVESASSRDIDATPEQDNKGGVMGVYDDELVGEEVEGGIRFTFNALPIICVTPPPGVCVTPPPEIRITPPMETSMMTPAVRPRVDNSISNKVARTPELAEADDDESSLTFVFPPKSQSTRVRCTTSPSSPSPPTFTSSFCPSSTNDSPRSSIPRAVSLRSMSPKTPSIVFTPSKNVPGRFAAPNHPMPLSRTPSSIPQLATPLKSSIPTKVQTPTTSPKQINDSMPDPRCSSFAQSGCTTSEVNGSNKYDPSSTTRENFHVRDTPSLSIMSNPLAARSPFQKLSNFISFSWSPGAAAVASYIIPSSSGSPSAEATDTIPSLSSVGNGATCPAQRRFIPRTQQLERLRSRLSLEKKNGMTPCCIMSACKGCSASDVYL